MDENDKKKLDRILELVEDNNAYIKKVRSTQKTSQMFRAIYWVVIIAIALGGYYFIEPYFSKLESLYSSVMGTSSGLKMPSSDSVQNLLNKLK